MSTPQPPAHERLVKLSGDEAVLPAGSRLADENRPGQQCFVIIEGAATVGVPITRALFDAEYGRPKTIEYHLAHIFAKLGIRTRYQLAALCGPLDDGHPGRHPAGS
jgi:hypothetical protein